MNGQDAVAIGVALWAAGLLTLHIRRSFISGKGSCCEKGCGGEANEQFQETNHSLVTIKLLDEAAPTSIGPRS